MNKSDVEEIFGNNEVTFSKVEISDLIDIMKYVSLDIKMDKVSLDYYYIINVNELLTSAMPIEIVKRMGKNGWSFDEEQENLILYII